MFEKPFDSVFSSRYASLYKISKKSLHSHNDKNCKQKKQKYSKNVFKRQQACWRFSSPIFEQKFSKQKQNCPLKEEERTRQFFSIFVPLKQKQNWNFFQSLSQQIFLKYFWPPPPKQTAFCQPIFEKFLSKKAKTQSPQPQKTTKILVLTKRFKFKFYQEAWER